MMTTKENNTKSGFEFQGFKMRLLANGDAESLAFHANNLKIKKQMTNGFPYPFTEKNARELIAQSMQDQPPQVFAIDIEGEAVGAVCIVLQNGCAELGYWLGEKYWNRGIMTQAVRKMVEYTTNYFSINDITASVSNENYVSIRILEKAGFKIREKGVYYYHGN